MRLFARSTRSALGHNCLELLTNYDMLILLQGYKLMSPEKASILQSYMDIAVEIGARLYHPDGIFVLANTNYEGDELLYYSYHSKGQWQKLYPNLEDR